MKCRFDPAEIYLIEQLFINLNLTVPIWTAFINFSGLSVLDFEQVNVGWVELGQAFSHR